MNKPYFCRNCFLMDWRNKRLKNTIDLSLFYVEHFYGFSECVFKNICHEIEITYKVAKFGKFSSGWPRITLIFLIYVILLWTRRPQHSVSALAIHVLKSGEFILTEKKNRKNKNWLL